MTTSPQLLLCRPVGGLNDMLAQIDNACRYAEQFRRTVVVETDSQSSNYFKDAFSNYFISKQPMLRLTAAHHKNLFDKLEVCPKFLFGRVNSYAAIYVQEKQGYVDTETQHRLTFDFSRAHNEPLLVHHAAGANGNSISALVRIRLHDAIVDTLLDRLHTIRLPYTAIHVRHTDYQMDYEKELVKRRHEIDGAVLIATDNRDVVEFCRSVFGRDRVYSFARLPDRPGKPAHVFEGGEPVYEINRDAIIDLLLVSLANQFIFFPLSTNIHGSKYSGYTMLARALRNFPFVVQQLIGRCDDVVDSVMPIYR